MPGQLEQRPARKRLPSTSSRRSCFSGRLFPSLTLGIVVPRICNHLGPGWVANHGAMLHLKLWLLRNTCGSNSLNFRSIKRGKIRNESLGSPTTIDIICAYIMSIYTVTHSYTYIRYCIIYVITCAMLMESNLLRSVTSSAKRHHNWSNWSAISPIHSYTTILWLELIHVATWCNAFLPLSHGLGVFVMCLVRWYFGTSRSPWWVLTISDNSTWRVVIQNTSTYINT